MLCDKHLSKKADFLELGESKNFSIEEQETETGENVQPKRSIFSFTTWWGGGGGELRDNKIYLQNCNKLNIAAKVKQC